MSAHPNRLAGETSPYLLQHAHNPVDWYPWGVEAHEKARREDKPILLSIGYAACHWCHVMERESFEDEAIAALMNEHFVCIKVDREERPDVDEIYMAATVAMSGAGGWPMTVFLTPEGHEPFFAGTYFPPEDRYGRPGLPRLLRRIAELWRSERSALGEQGRQLAQELSALGRAAAPVAVGVEVLDRAGHDLAATFDPRWGGFGGAPKFPPATSLELLLRQHRRRGDEAALGMVRVTLDGMARGGMRDHLGGGFARYSVDERWLVPHFEKMLYDNALLARAYAHAYQVMADPGHRRVVCETLDWMLRDMVAPAGGLFSATDADSEGVEGKYFVWTAAEIEAALPAEQARAFAAYYDVTREGNFEGHSVLHTPRSLEEVAAELERSGAELEALLAEARTTLAAVRATRVPPLTDDKILTSWNALAIGALAEAGRIVGEPRYLAAAVRAADFLESTMTRPDGGLYRTSRAGKAHLDGYLEDYAYLADALVDVYEAGGGQRHLRRALGIAERMLADFHDDEAGGFFATARGHEKLLVRVRDGRDGATPAANAVAACALVRLGWHLGRQDLLDRAEGAIRAHGKLIERVPRAFAASLCVVDMLRGGPVEVVAVGAADDPATQALLAEVARHYLPNRILVHHDPEGTQSSLAPPALLAGKTSIDGAPTLYVCRDFACARPVTLPEEVAAALGEAAARTR